MGEKKSPIEEYRELKKALIKHENLYFNKQEPEISDADYDKLRLKYAEFKKQHPHLVASEEYRKLKKEVIKHDNFYFNKQEPVISDAAYDKLYQELAEFEKLHPNLVATDSPTQQVGAPLQNTLAEIKHKVPMLSLDKAFDLHQTSLFFERCEKLTGSRDFLITPKLDGVAVVIGYEDHEMRYAATRGDGRVGEDVTANMRLIKNIPNKLARSLPPDLELRGEVTLTHDGFAKANAFFEEIGDKPFVNPRNAAAGILRRKEDLKAAVLEGLSFTAFWAIDREATENDALELFNWLEKSGIPVAQPYEQVSNLKEFQEYLGRIEKLRGELKQDIDGIVLRLNDQNSLLKMGTTAKFSRGMLAYKFSDQEETTTLRKVIYQLGRTGKLTPVGVLDPVEINGVSVSRVTLHNYELIKKIDLRIDDQVGIIRSGEVIPKLVRINYGKRTGESLPIVMPRECVSCGGEVVKKSVDLMCLSKDCKNIRLAGLRYFVSRDAMDIDGLGREILEKLHDEKGLRRPAQIFELNKEQLDVLYQKDSKKEEDRLRTEKLLNAIDKARSTSLWRVIKGLGLSGIGSTAARELEQYVGSLEKIRRSSPEALCFLPSITFAAALNLCDYLSGEDLLESDMVDLAFSFTKLDLADRYIEAYARRDVHFAYVPRDQIDVMKQAGVNWPELKPAGMKCTAHSLLAHISYLRRIYPEGSIWPVISETFLRRLQANTEKAPSIEELRNEDIVSEIATAKTREDALAALSQLLAMPEFKRLCAELEDALGISWGMAESEGGELAGINGLKLLVTGVLEGYTRQEAKDLVVKHGGKVASAISSKVDLVVVGEKPSEGKLRKADILDVRTITANEFFKLLGLEAN